MLINIVKVIHISPFPDFTLIGNIQNWKDGVTGVAGKTYPPPSLDSRMTPPNILTLQS